VERSRNPGGFAVWITGLPASGKSTLAAAVKAQLAERGIEAALLESDELRKVLAPQPRYDEEGRDLFYHQMIYIGWLLTQHGVPVLFDATANLRRYRDDARKRIGRFLEVYVDTPLETCMARDPKGIYRIAATDAGNTVPGLKSPYEPPVNPDVLVHGDQEPVTDAAKRVVTALEGKGFI
jgi:adenylylsulfate kinase